MDQEKKEKKQLCCSDLARESSQEQRETLPNTSPLKSFLEALSGEDQSIAEKIANSCSGHYSLPCT